MKSEFGVWVLPATIGAVKAAASYRFGPAHYDAVERWVKRAGNTEITRQDVENVRVARDSHEAAICGGCGLFHDAPACGHKEPPNAA